MKLVLLCLVIVTVGCTAARPNYAARFVSTVSTAKCLPWGAQGDISAAMCVADGSVYFCTATPTTMPKCEAVSGPARAIRAVDQKAKSDAAPASSSDPPAPVHHPDPERKHP